MSPVAWWSQSVDATLYLKRERWSVCDERKIPSRFFSGGEDGVMGSLAARRVAESDWTSVWQAVVVYIFPVGTARGNSSCATAPLAVGVDARGTRGDIPGIAAHRSARLMARLLGHSPSTVSREISRNGGYDRYRAALADEQAWFRAVVRSVVSWRTAHHYDGQWRESSD